jgi:glycogen synthase
MKNVFVFSSFYKPHLGGVEKYVENFYKRLPNHKVTVVTSKYDKSLKKKEKDENLNIVRIDSIKILKDKYYIPTLKGFKEIKKLIRDNTEIHTHCWQENIKLIIITSNMVLLLSKMGLVL